MIEQLLVYGLLNGAFYALIALGFSMVWASMKMINIAHAVVVVSVSYVTVTLFQSFNIDPLITMVIMIPVMFIVGIIIYKSLITHLYKSTRYEEVSTIATFGLALAIQNLLLLFYGPGQKGISLPWATNINIGIMQVLNFRIIAAVLAVIATYVIYLIVSKSYFGKSVRAAWQEETAACLHGICVNRVRMITFGLALSTTAIAGAIVPIVWVVNPQLHWSFLVYIFLIVSMGGVGSILGTTTAGVVVGLVDAIATLFINSGWVPIVNYSIFILILFIKPGGLFKGYK